MDITVTNGDALDLAADVLVLKHAQDTFGVDALVVRRLQATGTTLIGLLPLPKPGAYRLVETNGAIRAAKVLFVGVVRLGSFGYEGVRDFATRALAALADASPQAAHVAFTLQGAGFGLDEAEAFRAELGGILDAIAINAYPPALKTITIVELDAGRASRLQVLLDQVVPRSSARGAATGAWTAAQPESLRTAGIESRAKPHVFVAMPFAPEFEDPFHYGIQQAVHAAGYLCERADLASFTGDVVTWVKERIDSAHLLVADLSTANPNVYLEVGYAWGRGVPTVLLARDASELKFDVKGQRCLVYGSIRKLEELLTRELIGLRQSR